MPGQSIGTINVQVGQPTNINAQVGQATNPRVPSLSYGGPIELKTAIDLSLASAADGGAITYHANTGTFTINSIASAITKIDNGFF